MSSFTVIRAAALACACVAAPVVAQEAAPPGAEASVPEVEAVRVAPPGEWAGEQKRFHFGAGIRFHAGLMDSQSSLFLVLQTELLGVFSLRVLTHHEVRVQLGVAVGFADVFGGETNVGFRYHLSPRLSVGLGVLAYWGMSSLRGGLEIPVALRLDASRHHELSIALRGNAGVINESTLVWWDFSKQRFALAAELAIGYAFIF